MKKVFNLSLLLISAFSLSACGIKEERDEINTGFYYWAMEEKLPFSVDYSNSNLLEVVKKGDVVLDPTGFPAGSFGWSGHAMIVEGIFFDEHYEQYYIRTVEANLNNSFNFDGVTRGILSAKRFINNNMKLLRVISASEEELDVAVEFAISQIGDKYNLIDSALCAFDKGQKSYNKDKDSWYCSELVWASFIAAGIELDPYDNSDNSYYIWPSYLEESDKTVTILEGNQAYKERGNE